MQSTIGPSLMHSSGLSSTLLNHFNSPIQFNNSSDLQTLVPDLIVETQRKPSAERGEGDGSPGLYGGESLGSMFLGFPRTRQTTTTHRLPEVNLTTTTNTVRLLTLPMSAPAIHKQLSRVFSWLLLRQEHHTQYRFTGPN